MAVPEVEVVAAEVIEFTIPPGEGDGYSDHFPVTATVQLDGSTVAVPALSWPGAAVLVGLLVWQMRRSGQRSR